MFIAVVNRFVWPVLPVAWVVLILGVCCLGWVVYFMFFCCISGSVLLLFGFALSFC